MTSYGSRQRKSDNYAQSWHNSNRDYKKVQMLPAPIILPMQDDRVVKMYHPGAKYSPPKAPKTGKNKNLQPKTLKNRHKTLIYITLLPILSPVVRQLSPSSLRK